MQSLPVRVVSPARSHGLWVQAEPGVRARVRGPGLVGAREGRVRLGGGEAGGGQLKDGERVPQVNQVEDRYEYCLSTVPLPSKFDVHECA